MGRSSGISAIAAGPACAACACRSRPGRGTTFCLGAPRTEYICPYGHGTLKVDRASDHRSSGAGLGSRTRTCGKSCSRSKRLRSDADFRDATWLRSRFPAKRCSCGFCPNPWGKRVSDLRSSSPCDAGPFGLHLLLRQVCAHHRRETARRTVRQHFPALRRAAAGDARRRGAERPRSPRICGAAAIRNRATTGWVVSRAAGRHRDQSRSGRLRFGRRGHQDSRRAQSRRSFPCAIRPSAPSIIWSRS